MNVKLRWFNRIVFSFLFVFFFSSPSLVHSLDFFFRFQWKEEEGRGDTKFFSFFNFFFRVYLSSLNFFIFLSFYSLYNNVCAFKLRRHLSNYSETSQVPPVGPLIQVKKKLFLNLKINSPHLQNGRWTVNSWNKKKIRQKNNFLTESKSETKRIYRE